MNEDFNVFEEKVLTRINILEEEVNKLRRFLECVRKGLPFEESWNEEIFYEVNGEYSSIRIHLVIIIEHIFKLAFCTNSESHEEWISQILDNQRDLMNLIGWGSKKPNRNKIDYLYNNLGDNIYYLAKEIYIKDAREFPDLADGIHHIPYICPWVLEQLIEASPSDLVKILKEVIKEEE